MAYPTGVSLVSITTGAVTDFFGGDAAITATVTPVLKGTTHIVHEQSGAVLVPSAMVFTASQGEGISFTVPHVDQDGWRDGAGNAYKMWAYRVVVKIASKRNQDMSWTKTVQPVVGQALIDLDLVADGQIGIPVSAPTPQVLSVNGQTGVVEIETGGADDTDIAALVADTATFTGAALSTRYATKAEAATDDADVAALVQDGTSATGTAVVTAVTQEAFQVAVRGDVRGAGGDVEALPWRVELAKRYTKPTNLVCIGTSFTEGTGAPSWRTRWQGVLQQQLRAKYQPAGVAGAALPFIQAYPNAGGTITDFPVTRTGTINRATWTGLGMHTAEIVDDAAVLTFTFTGTSAALAYAKGSFGKMLVSVDGGTAVSTDMYAATASGGNLYPITGLAAGDHTVTVRRDPTSASGRRVPIEGLYVYNSDETKGVRVLDGGYHGADTGLFLTSTAANIWPLSVKSANPSAVILDLGFNDATNGMAVETFEANLTTIISKIRGQGTFAGTIFLVSWPKRAVNTQELWDSYNAAIRRVAAAQSNVVLLPLVDWMPSEGASSSDPANMGLYDGTDHPNQAGHALIADLIAGFI